MPVPFLTGAFAPLLAALLALPVLAAGAAGTASQPAAQGAPWRLAQPAAPGEIALVHVAANTGGAGGGHLALRVAGTAFHYQRRPDGRLLLARESWPVFVQRYNDLGNRALRLARVSVEPEAVGALLETFAAEHVAQQRDLAEVERLEEDLAWIEALARTAELPPLRGAGLLRPGAERASAESSAQDPAQALPPAGDGEAAAEARALSLLAAAPDTDLAALREALLEWQAFRALRAGWAPPAEALLPAPGSEGLSRAERSALAALAESQHAAVLALLDAPRPDRGLALHVAAARRHAARESLRQGRLLVVDPWPSDALRLDAQQLAGAAARGRLAERAEAVAVRARAELLGAPAEDGKSAPGDPALHGAALRDPALGLLEEIVARAAELRRAASGEGARHAEGRLLPQRAASPDIEGGPLAEALAAAAGADWEPRRRAAASALAARSAARGPYALLAHNCVTRLAEALAAALPDPVAALGGALPSGAGLGAVPWIVFDEAASSWRVTVVEEIAGRRLRELSRLVAEGAGPLDRLREATTVAATLYEPRDADGRFLLFTDDLGLSRPLAGAANLAFGLGAAVAGLLSLPSDGGDALLAGAHGALFSLPELVGICLRKGSYEVPLGPP